MCPDDVIFYNEEVAAGPLGDEILVLAVLDGALDAFVMSCLLGQYVAQEIQTLYITAQPADILSRIQ